MANELRIKKGLIVSGSSQLSGSLFITPNTVPNAPDEDTVLVLQPDGQVSYKEAAVAACS